MTAARQSGERAAGPLARALVCLALGLVSVGPAVAQQSRPDGLVAGPWILAPSLTTQYSVDDNLFREAERFEPETERVTTVRGRLDAYLLFRNSRVQLFYQEGDQTYDRNTFDRERSRTVGATVTLNFSRGHTLRLRETSTRDFTRIGDALDEAVFRGEPFDLNRWEIELSRSTRGQQSYLMRVARTDFNSGGATETDLFDYRGFDTRFEYGQPLAGDRWFTVSYSGRRFNHYDPLGPVGVPFRHESADALNVGLRGRLGPRQRYTFLIGAGRSELDGAGASDFSGVVGEADWEIEPGGRTELRVAVSRRPLPSIDDTFYILTDLRAVVDRRLTRRIQLEATGRLASSEYGDFIPGIGCPAGSPRDDLRQELRAALDWFVHPRLALRVEGGHELRGSNCDAVEYDATFAGLGFTLGWF